MSDLEFVRTQWQQAAETFRSQITLLVQWCTIMAVGFVTVLGYGTAQKRGFLIMLGSAFPLMVIAMLRRFGRHAQPIIYTAIRIEHQQPDDNYDFLATTYAIQIAGVDYIERLLVAAADASAESRMARLARVKPPSLFGSTMLPGLLLLVALGQLALGAVLGSHQGWTYF